MNAPSQPPLEVAMGNIPVAFYFEQGAARPVTFAEFVQIVQESPTGDLPAYLNLEPGFVGMMVLIMNGGSSIAVPKFVNPMRMVQ
jgi:hypothetical protein